MEEVVSDLGKDMIFVNDGPSTKIKGAFIMEALLKDTSDEIVECEDLASDGKRLILRESLVQSINTLNRYLVS